jgi:putative transposase
MAWKECNVMDQKLKFIAQLLEGEKMTYVCEEFGISRKTGHKIWKRYKDEGAKAFTDRSRTPYRYANQLPPQMEILILRLKREKPHWGAPKIRELVIRKYPDLRTPAISTIHAVLDRNGLVQRKRRRKYKAQGTLLNHTEIPNNLWCADYKGQFMMGNRQYCYPLTITDYASRFLFTCEALETTQEKYTFSVFERAFREYGLPKVIRTDNGLPFSSPNALFGLSKLSVWWLRLGIEIERIKPGNPQQNGRHERMHLTLKKETTRPAGMNTLQQQNLFDHFIDEYNFERPHQALSMKCPGDIYYKSPRIYHGVETVEYPLHERTVMITTCGRICMKKKKINISRALAGQNVGIKEVEDGIWLVTFMTYDLGYFDEENKRLEPLVNPFGAKVLPMSPV